MSLFKDGCIRKPDKSALRSCILVNKQPAIPLTSNVVDGGALLHQVYWPPNTTYDLLILQYVKAVRQQFGDCHVVFDGYEKPSIKDQEHIRRSAFTKTSDIQFRGDMKVTLKREEFLSNKNNKSLLIKRLSISLLEDSQEIKTSLGDADTEIVKVALKVSCTLY